MLFVDTRRNRSSATEHKYYPFGLLSSASINAALFSHTVPHMATPTPSFSTGLLSTRSSFSSILEEKTQPRTAAPAHTPACFEAYTRSCSDTFGTNCKHQHMQFTLECDSPCARSNVRREYENHRETETNPTVEYKPDGIFESLTF